MFKFTFTNRNEYFQQKAEWFVHYQAAVKELQVAKNNIKEANRSGGWTFTAHINKNKAAERVLELLQARWDSKKEANRQWLANINEASQ